MGCTGPMLWSLRREILEVLSEIRWLVLSMVSDIINDVWSLAACSSSGTGSNVVSTDIKLKECQRKIRFPWCGNNSRPLPVHSVILWHVCMYVFYFISISVSVPCTSAAQTTSLPFSVHEHIHSFLFLNAATVWEHNYTAVIIWLFQLLL